MSSDSAFFNRIAKAVEQVAENTTPKEPVGEKEMIANIHYFYQARLMDIVENPTLDGMDRAKELRKLLSDSMKEIQNLTG